MKNKMARKTFLIKRLSSPKIRSIILKGKEMYRYSLKKFNDSLFVMGGIRIGTLHDFRNAEHKVGIADPKEGTKIVSHHIDHLHIEDSSDTSRNNKKDIDSLSAFKAISLGRNCKNTTISNVSLSNKFNEPNMFILCASKYLSKETMSQFEGADNCVEITNGSLFYQLITETLNRITPVVFHGLHEVIYQDREEQWDGSTWGRHPAMIKEKEFGPQGELRAIWQPKHNIEMQPIIISNYRIGACVSHVAI
jgi:hypothetical protein